jgi:hypothetical protein
MRKVFFLALLILGIAAIAVAGFDLGMTVPPKVLTNGTFTPEESCPYVLAFAGDGYSQIVIRFFDNTTGTMLDYINVCATNWSKVYNLTAGHQYEVYVWSEKGGYFLAEPH